MDERPACSCDSPISHVLIGQPLNAVVLVSGGSDEARKCFQISLSQEMPRLPPRGVSGRVSRPTVPSRKWSVESNAARGCDSGRTGGLWPPGSLKDFGAAGAETTW